MKRLSFIVATLALALVGALIGCGGWSTSSTGASTPTGPAWFADVSGEVGLDFTHDPGPIDGKYFMPQTVGSGAALFDFDGDGLLDIYLLNNGGMEGRPNQLYKQKPDGTFVNVSKGSGLDFSGYCMGVAIGDVNNDGKPDVLVTLYGGVKLFLNKGDGTFQDVTKEAGLDNPAWGASPRSSTTTATAGSTSSWSTTSITTIPGVAPPPGEPETTALRRRLPAASVVCGTTADLTRAERRSASRT